MNPLWQYIFAMVLVLLLGSATHAQSGRQKYNLPVQSDDTERVITEEIKLNVSAFGTDGFFRPGVGSGDLVILEDGVIHQPESVRRIPANIVLVLDTGGEDRHAKDFRTTLAAARALIERISPESPVTLIEVNDEVRVLAEWSTDRSLLLDALSRQLRFGRRSQIVEGLKMARLAFERWKSENRHLILVTDGVGSPETESERSKVMSSLLETDINVHVVSYTKMEQAVVSERRRSVSAGNRKIAIPPGGNVPVQGQTPTGTLGTINLDRAMVRKINERGESLVRSEVALVALAAGTGGEMINPSTREEMVAQMAYLARVIDSNYVVTYVPKRPLAAARDGEERNIEVTSRRYDIAVQAKRKLIVRTVAGRQ